MQIPRFALLFALAALAPCRATLGMTIYKTPCGTTEVVP